MAAVWSATSQPPGSARQQAIPLRNFLSEQMHLGSVPQPSMPLARNLLAQLCCERGETLVLARETAGGGFWSC